MLKAASDHGCKVTAYDLRPNTRQSHPRLRTVQGDISDESSISSSIADAKRHFGPINILVANAGIADESRDWPIWETPLEVWKKTYEANVQGTFLTIKHFLQSAKSAQEENGKELEHLAIVVTGSETGKFGQAGLLVRIKEVLNHADLRKATPSMRQARQGSSMDLFVASRTRLCA